MLEVLVNALLLFVYQGYRLIRAEPIERWVVPVSNEEIDRAGTQSSSSPISSTTPVKGSSNKGTPSTEAAKEAIGRRYGTVPPSPIMPPTPVTAYNSFSTPDTTGSASKIMGDAVSFGKDALGTMMRALASALCAIRRLHSTMSVPLFEPTMILAADRPSLGLLVAIQLHATHELQRKTAFPSTPVTFVHRTIFKQRSTCAEKGQTMSIRWGF